MLSRLDGKAPIRTKIRALSYIDPSLAGDGSGTATLAATDIVTDAADLPAPTPCKVVCLAA